MRASRVYMVVLRRPRKKKDLRSDPFWEFGSFGCTGCHAHNLLHPKHQKELKGARLAFAQGGKLGFLLVLLTPPIRQVIQHKYKQRLECRWRSTRNMPFKYEEAPRLTGKIFPEVRAAVEGVVKDTLQEKFASKFRAQSHPLDSSIADKIVRVWRDRRGSRWRSDVAVRYEQALPISQELPVDKKSVAASIASRKREYRELLRKCAREAVSISLCGTPNRKVQK